MNPILLTDFYKVHHYFMYPEGTAMIYSNFTPRKSRNPEIKGVVFFGLQHFVKKYLLGKFKTEFFDKPWEVVAQDYAFAINTTQEHIKELHDLGYLPIEIKALPEGSICPIGVPCFTIRNTNPKFGWLTNYLETLISCQMWQPITSATIANEYKKMLSKYAIETTGTDEFVQWQGHDFSMRGMSSVESAILSGMAHLTSFTGTDTIPAIYALRNSYNATGLIGASVPATEHSVMCMGTKEAEIETFRRLLRLYPSGILSVVSDTWNLWDVCTKFLPELKEEILARNGKLVIRPDSGDPVDIICGLIHKHPHSHREDGTIDYHGKSREEYMGVIELLWETFGGTIVKGADGNDYKVLDSHIGAIYGDSITIERAKQICERLKAKGFASTNLVLGIGSYTYQYNTRDNFGFAMKATYGEVEEEYTVDGVDTMFPLVKNVGREIFKAPITDDGTKRSAKGLLHVYEGAGGYKLKDQCTWEEERQSALQTVFINGQLIRETTLEEIRKRLKN